MVAIATRLFQQEEQLKVRTKLKPPDEEKAPNPKQTKGPLTISSPYPFCVV